MEFISRHVVHQPDQFGIVNYSPLENQIWNILFERQLNLLPGRGCDEHLQGLKDLDIAGDKIPQLSEINLRLKELTDWEVIPVLSMVPALPFFTLLASKKFPVTTFIRFLDEIDYAKEPDIFHDLFGHCPMLMNTCYADFIYYFACQALKLNEEDLLLMQKIFMFTAEFGLIDTPKGLRAYGAGLLSSPYEILLSLNEELTPKMNFDLSSVLNASYHFDKKQDIYFIIQSYQQLLMLVSNDLILPHKIPTMDFRVLEQ